MVEGWILSLTDEKQKSSMGPDLKLYLFVTKSEFLE